MHKIKRKVILTIHCDRCPNWNTWVGSSDSVVFQYSKNCGWVRLHTEGLDLCKECSNVHKDGINSEDY